MVARKNYWAVFVIATLLCVFLSPPVYAVVREEVSVNGGMEAGVVRSDTEGSSVSSLSPVSSSSGQNYVPGDVIVVFKSQSGQSTYGAYAEHLSEAAGSVGAQVAETYSELSAGGDGVFARLKVPEGSEAQALTQLMARPDVAGAQLNYKYTISAITPSDTKYSSLWGMPAIKAPDAWELNTGSENVYVAVIDSGIDYTHADIRDNFEASGYSGNYSSGTTAGDYSDGNGHGTHVAGTIGAVGNNGLGVVGVNWKTKLISLRVFNASGSCSTSNILNALNALLKLLNDHPSLKIASVNMSYGSSEPTTERPETLTSTPEYLAYKALSDTNRIVLCVAAGNEGIEIGNGQYVYPASFTGLDNMIVVANAQNNSSYTRSSSSNYSTSHVDVAAPGTNILSTAPQSSTLNSSYPGRVETENGYKYLTISGTSMATPHVAGAVALLASAYPDADARALKDAILRGANASYAKTYTANGFLDVSKSLEILAGTYGNTVPPEIISTTLAKGYLQEAYDETIQAKGARPITWTKISGTVPPGLTFSAGRVYGTPTSPGNYTFKVKASNANGSDTKDITITIANGTPEILDNLKEGYIQEIYSGTLEAKGLKPITWSLQSGTLPPNLTLSSNGTISGAPSKAGKYSFTVKAQNSAGSSTRQLTLTIRGVTPAILSLRWFTNAVVGTKYSKQLETVGTRPITWSVVGGELPPGLTLDTSSGVISGTASKSGRYVFIVKAENEYGSHSESFLMYADDLPSEPGFEILTEELPHCYNGIPYLAKLETSSTEPVTWESLDDELIQGLTLDKNGIISGLYTVNMGTYTHLHVRASNSKGSVSKHVVFWYTCPGYEDARIITESLPDGVTGKSYNQYLSRTGYTSEQKFDISGGELPPGLVLTDEGYIEGTPIKSGTYTFTVRYGIKEWGTYEKKDFTVTIYSSEKKPSVIAAELPDATTGIPYRTGLKFTGTGPISWSYSGTMPPGMSFAYNKWDMNGPSYYIAGTPTTAGTYKFAVTATNSAGSDTKNLTINVQAGSVKPTITTATLPELEAGASCDVQLEASGTSPFVWVLTSGKLPAGLELSSGGRITGQPEECGSFDITLKAYNANGSAEKTFTLKVSASTAPVILTSSLPLAVTGIPYKAQLKASTGAATWSIVGSLPSWMAGLTLSESGVLSGIPEYDAWDTNGTSGGIMVRAANSKGSTLKYIPFTLNSEGLLPETFGDAYMRIGKKDIRNQSNDIRGGLIKGKSYKILLFRNFRRNSSVIKSTGLAEIVSGKLPDGLTMSDGDYCPVISGTPTKTGTFTFTIRAQHGQSSAYEEKTYTVEVKDAPKFFIPVITASSLPDGANGREYLYDLMDALAGWTPGEWTLTNRNLPPGLKIEDGTKLMGTPTSSGSWTFTLQFNGDAGKVSQEFSLNITASASAPTITTPGIPEGYKGSGYYFAFTASGTHSVSAGSNRWGLVSGTLPDGLALNSEGVIAGTPTSTGTWTFRVYVRNEWGSSAKTFTMRVVNSSAPVITTQGIPAGTLSAMYSADISATGPEPMTWEVSGISGISWQYLGNTRTARIFFTPTTTGTYYATVRAINSAGQTSRTFTITIKPAPPEITTTPPLPYATRGMYYSYTFKARGTTPITWALSGGSLPSGVRLNSSTGYLSGVPTVSGTFSFYVKAGNSGGYGQQKQFTLTVIEPPEITTTALPYGKVGKNYSFDVSAKGTTPITWTVGGLPSEITATEKNGGATLHLSGTPSSTGSYTVTFKVANSGDVTDNEFMTLSIIDRGVEINSENFPDATFRGFVQSGYDTDNDGWLDREEAGKGTTFNLENRGITSLKGIEHFPALSYLSCYNNKLTTLDLSRNTALTVLMCYDNNLGTLDLSKNTALTRLSCLRTGLTSLNVSKNTALKELYCWENKLTSLDVSNNTALVVLSCYNNQLTSLNVSKNTALTQLRCEGNQLTALDLTANASINNLTCSTQYPLNLRSAKKSDDVYYVDFSGYTQGMISRVSNVRGYDEVNGGSLIALSSYDTAKGTAKFPKLPKLITYIFDTGRTNSPNRYMTVSLKIPARPVIVTDYIPDAEANIEYSFTFEATTNSTKSVSWDITGGNLPAGLTLGKATGKLTGTPTETGTFTFTLKAETSDGRDTKAFTFKAKPPAPIITSDTLPGGVVGKPYSATLKATSPTPVTWSMAGGTTLPAGLTLNASTGAITGTPTEAITKSVTFKATNSAGSRTKTLSITVMAVVADFPEYLVAGGTAPYTWKVVNGNIPKAWSLSYTTPGERVRVSIAPPAVPGTYTFTVRVTDKNGVYADDTQTVTVSRPSLGGSLPSGPIVGDYYEGILTATGGKASYKWSITSGELPEGLSYTASGAKFTLMGTPRREGIYTFAVTATDKYGARPENPRQFTLTATRTTIGSASSSSSVAAPKNASPVQSITAARKASFSLRYNVSGGKSPYKWKVSTGKLPDGLKLNKSTGEISGTLTKAGTYTFTIQADDKNGISDDKRITVKVTQTTTSGTIASTLTRKATYTKTLKASGGTAPYTWSVSSGKLPDGLKLKASTGKITGTLTKAGTFTFTIKAKDKNGAASTKSFTVKVTETKASGTIASTLTRKATYTKTLKASGGTAPYTWSVSSGKLPDGLKLKASTGKITGTLTKAGTFTFTIKAKDKNGAASTKSFTVKVTETKATGTIASTLTRKATYTKTLTASGGTAPYTWSVSSGKLPDGLKLKASTGKITGTLTKAGTFTFTIKAKDKNGAASTKSFTVKVTETKVTGKIPATATTGSTFMFTPKASGGAAPYKWSVSSGKLPTGLKLKASTGKISGIPTKAGTYTFTVKAKDKNGAAGTKKYTLKVTAATSANEALPGNTEGTQSGTPAENTQSLPSAPEMPGIVAGLPEGTAGTLTLHATLSVESDDILQAGEGRDSDLITVKAGKALTFIIGDWGVKVSGVTVFIDDKPAEGITVSEEGKFILPAERVSGDFKVYVKALHEGSELESDTLYIISE